MLQLLVLIGQIEILSGAGLDPGPGDVYKEYIITMSGNVVWRVTNPLAIRDDARKFLPNPVLRLGVDDLEDAVKATITLDYWGGHPKTIDRKFRVNNQSWIEIPYPETLPENPELYIFQYNPSLEIPLDHLKEGINLFEGTCTHYNKTGWGQWGWYAILLRIYYDREQSHTSGYIVTPSTGSDLTENPEILIAAESENGISRVDILGYYEDYDENGDGIYEDWHHAYFKEKDNDTLSISGHIGTLRSPPFNLVWNTSWIPDQNKPGNIMLIARIMDNDGYWYVTEPVTNLSLNRSSFSVKLCKPGNVPAEFIARGNGSVSSTIDVPEENLEQATLAQLLVRRWNGDNHDHGTITTLNAFTESIPGEKYHYDYNPHEISVQHIIPGENNISFVSGVPKTHGIEILWPGPSLRVKYDVHFTTVGTTDSSIPPGMTNRFQCYPNPFKYQTMMTGIADHPGEAILSIVDLNGKIVRDFVIYPDPSSGIFYQKWDGKDQSGFLVDNGLYFARIRSENLFKVIRLMFLPVQ